MMPIYLLWRSLVRSENTMEVTLSVVMTTWWFRGETEIEKEITCELK